MGFNIALNRFVDDGCLIWSSDSVKNITIVINSNVKKIIGSQYSSTMLMLPTFGVVGCVNASTLLDISNRWVYSSGSYLVTEFLVQ